MYALPEPDKPHRGLPRESFSPRKIVLAAHLRRHLVNLYRMAGRLDQADREHLCAAEAAKAAGRLSVREAEVAGYLCRPLTVPEIAPRMRLSTRTVETYVERIYAKLGVTDRQGYFRTILPNGIETTELTNFCRGTFWAQPPEK